MENISPKNRKLIFWPKSNRTTFLNNPAEAAIWRKPGIFLGFCGLAAWAGLTRFFQQSLPDGQPEANEYNALDYGWKDSIIIRKFKRKESS